MLSKNKIKLIQSLQLKKNRQALGLFVAEGRKLVFDLLGSSIEVAELWATEPLLTELFNLTGKELGEVATADELERASNLKSAPEMIALFKIPNHQLDWVELSQDLALVLDGVQDPGNLGTIIRLADWFGIRQIICSPDSADLFNPKVVQSTMGALARVNVLQLDLIPFLTEARNREIPVYGTFLEGENLYHSSITAYGLIVLGNEGNGISSSLNPYFTKKIRIPSYPQGVPTSESLNVAMAAAIVCAEFRRAYE